MKTDTTAPHKFPFMKYLKFIAGAFISIVLLLILIIVVRFRNDAKIPYDVSLPEASIPTFDESEFDFTHVYDTATSIQTTGGAVFNIDDGVEEVILCGGRGQSDAIFKYENGGFKEITKEVGYLKETDEASLSATSLDVDHDGDDDLIITRSNSIWLYTNNQGQLTGQKLSAPLSEDTSPISIAVTDINRDGHFDMYVCGYIKKELLEGLNIFNKEGYGGMSAFLINNGDNTFSDKTDEYGLRYKHNTFQAVFYDADLDGHEDLIVAHDTGQIRTWKNLGNGKFENVTNPNSEVFSYPMGIGVADYDNDGLVDFFFSNTGTTAPPFLAKGDLRDDQVYHADWILFHNEGDFTFTDTAEETKLADYEFSWGCIFDDFNLDGRSDLVVSENFVDLPIHKFEFLRLPCRFLIQNVNGEFAAVGEESGVVNKRFSLSPISGDFNQDGAPDLIHVNLAGRSKAFISNNSSGNFVKVKLPNTVHSVSAMVSAQLSDGRTIYEPFVKGEGLCSDSSPIVIIGTGGAKVKSIQVKYLSGKTETFQNPPLGSTLVTKKLAL